MADDFKDVLARLPAGVAIVTTRDEHGTPHGMTVSSFCSVSLTPPLVLVCLARSSRCFPVFARAERFAVSILRAEQTDLARRFATRLADKFAAGGFAPADDRAPIVEDALGAVECRIHQRHDAGDHVIVVGEVVDQVLAAAGPPAIYFDRRFATLDPAPVAVGGEARGTG
ncbi:flavin reductase family protein [Actinokineospora sp. PR83]|uniref:flavin reductase family protein n=1 Tax=Actinokineospora sp. PR83 TaxID=2884908 RepID=UPI001F29C139|nr:flavin reductase family protein [Actinokineospora sp. PR83]MCG8916567.1 flavin reductase family protein [Actinokineospora sp. PR83]